jgi:hypothetical protein
MPIGMADMEYGDISDSFMIKPSKHKETILRIGTALNAFHRIVLRDDNPDTFCVYEFCFFFMDWAEIGLDISSE